MRPSLVDLSIEVRPEAVGTRYDSPVYHHHQRLKWRRRYQRRARKGVPGAKRELRRTRSRERWFSREFRSFVLRGLSRRRRP